MGSYSNTTIKDAAGNIIGYRPVTADAPYVPGGITQPSGGGQTPTPPSSPSAKPSTPTVSGSGGQTPFQQAGGVGTPSQSKPIQIGGRWWTGPYSSMDFNPNPSGGGGGSYSGGSPVTPEKTPFQLAGGVGIPSQEHPVVIGNKQWVGQYASFGVPEPVTSKQPIIEGTQFKGTPETYGLGLVIGAEQSYIDEIGRTKVNAKNEFIGTEKEYNIYSEVYNKYKSDIDKYGLNIKNEFATYSKQQEEAYINSMPSPFRSTNPMDVKPFLSTPSIIETKPQRGELPFLGYVPYISDIISKFEPVVTTISQPTTPKTYTFDQYSKMGGVSYSPYEISPTGEKISMGNSLITVTPYIVSTKYGKTPVDQFIQNILPPSEEMNTQLRIASLSNPMTAPTAIGATIAETISEVVKPYSPWWSEGIKSNVNMIEELPAFSMKPVYHDIREQPTMSGISYTIGLLTGGAGIAPKILSLEKYAMPGTTGAKILSEGSRVVSSVLGVMYASDVSQRSTGLSFADLQKPNIENIQNKFTGVENTYKNLRGIGTTEIIPFMMGYGHGSFIGDKYGSYFTTRGQPRIENAEKFTYFTKEGYIVNPKITTPDLKASFTQGKPVLLNGDVLATSKMAPFGTKATRIPEFASEGAPEGMKFAYSAAENPHLATGKVGTGYSEIEALYTSPTGLSYYTKAGLQQGGGGIGVSNDIFGIMRSPTVYRIPYAPKDIITIPKNILETPYPKGMSINDPTNPRNIAINKFMETVAYGQPIVGQYGKSEFQALFRAGSEVQTKKIGYFIDKPTGVRIMVQEAKFTGKGTPVTREISPEGLTMREVARNYASFGSISSGKGSSKTPALFPSLFFGRYGSTSKTSGKASASSVSTKASVPSFSRLTYSSMGISRSRASPPSSLPASSKISSGKSSPASSIISLASTGGVSTKGSSPTPSKVSSPFSSPPISSPFNSPFTSPPSSKVTSPFTSPPSSKVGSPSPVSYRPSSFVTPVSTPKALTYSSMITVPPATFGGLVGASGGSPFTQKKKSRFTEVFRVGTGLSKAQINRMTMNITSTIKKKRGKKK